MMLSNVCPDGRADSVGFGRHLRPFAILFQCDLKGADQYFPLTIIVAIGRLSKGACDLPEDAAKFIFSAWFHCHSELVAGLLFLCLLQKGLCRERRLIPGDV